MSEKIEQMKARVVQAAGELADDDARRRQGRTDEQTASVKGRVRDLADEARDGIETVRKKATDAIDKRRKRRRP